MGRNLHLLNSGRPLMVHGRQRGTAKPEMT